MMKNCELAEFGIAERAIEAPSSISGKYGAATVPMRTVLPYGKAFI